jgi:quinol monooxygenase YgiN
MAAQGDQDVATLINVFAVTRDDQQPLVDLLIEATEQVMRHRPGFVSANIHASLDGTRVVNYVQWRSREDFQAMLDDPIAREHMSATLALATAEPRLYEVALVHHA